MQSHAWWCNACANYVKSIARCLSALQTDGDCTCHSAIRRAALASACSLNSWNRTYSTARHDESMNHRDTTSRVQSHFAPSDHQMRSLLIARISLALFANLRDRGSRKAA
jgi:hypothetical protein